jgi:LysR family transcriptional regulator (chromosome initiation inhibitor)
MQWELAQLSALSAAVSEGTFEGAARALNVTPSAVSQRIKALETSVGRVLLQRSKPVRPTESGQAILLLARQIETLAEDAVFGLDDEQATDDATGSESGEGAGAPRAFVRMPIAVNADSLATWILPALAGLSSSMTFDLYREDQGHTTTLLREGTVMAAITAVAEPVQGCSSTPLGAMRYRPMASPAFAERWFAHGVTGEALGRAPVVVFDRRDELQADYLRSKTKGVVAPPKHFVPASADFVVAVQQGFGWGMVPDLQSAGLEVASGATGGADLDPVGVLANLDGAGVLAGLYPAGVLVDLDPAGAVDVPLFWQQWQLHTRSLERVAVAIKQAAARSLT